MEKRMSLGKLSETFLEENQMLVARKCSKQLPQWHWFEARPSTFSLAVAQEDT
jgi:hypothetical protein